MKELWKRREGKNTNAKIENDEERERKKTS